MSEKIPIKLFEMQELICKHCNVVISYTRNGELRRHLSSKSHKIKYADFQNNRKEKELTLELRVRMQ